MKPEELQGMMKRVYETCTVDPQCRSDDKRLIWHIWMDDLGAWWGMEINYDSFRKVSSPETIRRSRQKLQENGLCLPPDKVYQGRQSRAKDIRCSINDDLKYKGQDNEH